MPLRSVALSARQRYAVLGCRVGSVVAVGFGAFAEGAGLTGGYLGIPGLGVPLAIVGGAGTVAAGALAMGGCSSAGWPPGGGPGAGVPPGARPPGGMGYAPTQPGLPYAPHPAGVTLRVLPRYYGAASGEALARALLIAAVEGFPYKVFDASGRLVAKGEAGALTDDLPPGDYKVVVQAADQVLVAGVKVVAGRSTVVKVALKNGRFVLER